QLRARRARAEADELVAELEALGLADAPLERLGRSLVHWVQFIEAAWGPIRLGELARRLPELPSCPGIAAVIARRVAQSLQDLVAERRAVGPSLAERVQAALDGMHARARHIAERRWFEGASLDALGRE